MILVKANLMSRVSRAIRRWHDMPISPVISHGSECCDQAKEWFVAMDASLAGGAGSLVGPTWVSIRYRQGPSGWPLHWCELIDRDVISCNVFTSISCLLFKNRGFSTFPVHVIQQYPEHITRRWRNEWISQNLLAEWIYGELIRHEVCGIVTDGSLRLWDGTIGNWLEPPAAQGVGQVLALRPHTSDDAVPKTLRWGDYVVKRDDWTILPFVEERDSS
ncbi:MAG: hypothetical protein ACTSYL_06205 [Candidatus Thorarchaeota archaeon]